MEIYDFTVAPGKVATINAEGSFVYFISGSAGGADATISVRHDSTGDRSLLLPGQGCELEDGMVGRVWSIGNYAGAAPIVGRLLIGGAGSAFTDNRISGSVEVIDGGKARTLGENAFLGSVSLIGTAGNYSHVQLWNPAGTGKNLIVEALGAVNNTASGVSISLRTHATALATLYGNVPSKKAGGAASVGQLRTELSASYLPTTQDVYVIALQSGTMTTFKPTEPIVLPPGQGLTAFVSSPSGSYLTATFELFQEAI